MNVSDQNLRCFLLEKCFQRLLPHLHQIHFIVYLTIVMNQPTKQQDKPISNFHQFLCLSFANCVRFPYLKNSKCCKAQTLLPCQINISLFLCPLFKSFVSRFEKLSLPTHFIHFLKEEVVQ